VLPNYLSLFFEVSSPQSHQPWFPGAASHARLGKNLGLRCGVSNPCSCQEISADGAALGLVYGNLDFVAHQHFSLLMIGNLLQFFADWRLFARLLPCMYHSAVPDML